MLNVTFVGTSDRQLEQSLHAAAMQVSLVEVAQLTALASANAAQPDVLLLDLRSGYGLPPAVVSPASRVTSAATTLIGLLLASTRTEPSAKTTFTPDE